MSGRLRPVAEILDDFLVIHDGKSWLVSTLKEAELLAKNKQARWVRALRRGKTLRQHLAMVRRQGGDRG